MNVLERARSWVGERVEHAVLGHKLDTVARSRHDVNTWLRVLECSVCGERFVEQVTDDPVSHERTVLRFDAETVVLGDHLGDDAVDPGGEP